MATVARGAVCPTCSRRVPTMRPQAVMASWEPTRQTLCFWPSAQDAHQTKAMSLTPEGNRLHVRAGTWVLPDWLVAVMVTAARAQGVMP